MELKKYEGKRDGKFGLLEMADRGNGTCIRVTEMLRERELIVQIADDVVR